MSTPEPPLATTQSITFPFGKLQREAYLARPAGVGPFPGLVLIHEVYGLNDNIRDIATRFAQEGYATLAVDLFARHNRALCVLRLFGGMALRSLDNSGISELKAALAYLAKQPEVDPNKLGAVGFCMGGAFAIAWACTDERLKAIAPFYGMNPRPLTAVARACPVIGSYPEKDFTKAHGQKLDAALTRYNIPHEIKTYPGAKHSFFNDSAGSYNAEASADAWQRMLEFFAARLQ
jgi:carboxymethylenebutenolidase